MQKEARAKNKKYVKKKSKKRTQGLSKIQKLHNLNRVLEALRADTSSQEIESGIAQPFTIPKARSKQKPQSATLKLSHKIEIMTEFWKAVDWRFFDSQEQELLQGLEQVIEERALEVSPENGILKKNFFIVSKNTQINALNKANYNAHLELSLKMYLNAMHLVKERSFFCDQCQKKFENAFQAKYAYKIPKNILTERKHLKFLQKEKLQLEYVSSKFDLNFCAQCKRHEERVQRKTLVCKPFQRRQEILQRISKFKNLIKQRIESQRQPANFDIALELELIKKFLFIHLKEIEQKLLADNIELIVGKKKDLLYIKFIHFEEFFPMEVGELCALNRYRENNLFKIHKVSFKTVKPFFAYNTALSSYTLPQRPMTQKLLRQESKTFLTLKNHPKDRALSICHHCKFLGPSEYFYSCSFRLDRNKNPLLDTETQIFKKFFNLQNEFKTICDKKYCLYCVKNCYYYPLRAEKSSWICPFCTGTCFCLSCEYRDHYMRLFSLFKLYHGDVARLRRESPIERVIEYYHELFQRRRDLGLKRKADGKKMGKKMVVRIRGCDEKEDEHNGLDGDIRRRGRLVKQLQIMSLLKKRERLKRQIIDML